MTRYYRGMLTATLLAGLAMPAFAQTPAPAAPASPTTPAAASPDTAAPAKGDAAPDTKVAKPSAHKRHHTSTKHKAAAAADAKTTPPGQTK